MSISSRILFILLFCTSALQARTFAFIVTNDHGTRKLLVTNRSWTKLHPPASRRTISEESLRKLLFKQTGGVLNAKQLKKAKPVSDQKHASALLFEVDPSVIDELDNAIKAGKTESGREFVWITAQDLKNRQVKPTDNNSTTRIEPRMITREIQQWLTSGKAA